jgi:hypothetical protein
MFVKITGYAARLDGMAGVPCGEIRSKDKKFLFFIPCRGIVIRDGDQTRSVEDYLEQMPGTPPVI